LDDKTPRLLGSIRVELFWRSIRWKHWL